LEIRYVSHPCKFSKGAKLGKTAHLSTGSFKFAPSARLALARLNHGQRRERRELEGDLSKIVAIGKKPLHCLLEPFPEPLLCLKAKEFLSPADIQAPSRLSVGLGGVPIDLSCKACLCGNQGGKITNRDFSSCP
jgi:hypothetical protein